MAEYIEREAAIDAAIIAFNRIDQYPNKNIRDLIGAVPAADVRPVVTAEWEWDGDPFDEEWKREYRCSHCGKYALKDDDGIQELSDFCPNCGAEMR